MSTKPPSSRAFTRLEAVAVLAAVALLAALALPALANTKARAQRVTCVNNLSRIGQAFSTWAAVNGEQYPMAVPYSNGGTQNHPSGLNNNAWFQFRHLSNELHTPKFLVCPSDPTKRTESEWNAFGLSGNSALSYTLGHPRFEVGRGILSSDRNIAGASVSGCTYGIAPILSVGLPATNAAWTIIIHSSTGNLLFNDGSVEQTGSAALRNAMRSHPLESQVFHFMSP